MQFLQCTISVPGYPRGVASRPSHDGEGIETLVATSLGEFRTILGAEKRGGLELGAALELVAPGRAGSAPKEFEPTTSLRDPVWDPFSASIFFLDGQAVMRLSSDNRITLVAGHRSQVGDADGLGCDARFGFPRFPVPDGSGSLFLADGSRVCRVKLPRYWRKRSGCGYGTGTDTPSTEPSSTDFVVEAEVVTLLTVPGDIAGLSYVYNTTAHGGGGSGRGGGTTASASQRSGGGEASSLIYATETAIYRLPLSSDANTPTAAAAPLLAAAPVLLAGYEGAQGSWDARGSAARFAHISGLIGDANGGVLLADVDDDGGEGTALRRMTLDGTVTTLAAGLFGSVIWPSILPNGYVALCNMFPGSLLLLDLGVTPSPCSVAAAAATAAGSATTSSCAVAGLVGCNGGATDDDPTWHQRRTLSSDLGDLLDRQPDGTSDLTINVGGRAFSVHRGILAARCDYFRQRLTGGFPDGDSPVLPLPDADPDAFAVLLHFLYTGALDSPTLLPNSHPSHPLSPSRQHHCLHLQHQHQEQESSHHEHQQRASLLQPLAELADRLLLPDLCTAAQVQLLSTVTVDNVVELLMWAAERGGSFHSCQCRLVDWYLAHQVEVMEGHPEAVKRLMAGCPDLAFEVHLAAAKLARH